MSKKREPEDVTTDMGMAGWLAERAPVEPAPIKRGGGDELHGPHPWRKGGPDMVEPSAPAPAAPTLWPCGHSRPSWDDGTQCPACKAEGAPAPAQGMAAAEFDIDRLRAEIARLREQLHQTENERDKHRAHGDARASALVKERDALRQEADVLRGQLDDARRDIAIVLKAFDEDVLVRNIARDGEPWPLQQAKDALRQAASPGKEPTA